MRCQCAASNPTHIRPSFLNCKKRFWAILKHFRAKLSYNGEVQDPVLSCPMPAASAFRALGLFVVDGFLFEQECIGYRDAMAQSSLESGTVLRDNSEEGVDETRRRVRVASVPREVKSALK